MAQLEHIEAIEKRLWSAADTLRANSNYASNEYFLPVMGLVFLRHAYSRFLAVKDEIEANLPTRGGKTRALTKEDFSQKSAIFLQPKAQFDYLVALPDSEDRAKAIIEAMESIEADYENLRGVLPKSEYQELDNDVLGQLLRTLNPDELKQVSGDVFGRIYEYFLTQFADQKAHDGGEFFTPVSLVSLIANVLEPERGTVLDPACGSGGMFVQSARIVEEHGQSPTERLTFRGQEKNATTIRLAKMNLAVHGLEGDIQKAITYYEDPHELVGKADFVMANPPFNVDEIDADKVKNDPRLPFGLPGVNKKDKVSNGNYLWISYFYSYLNEKGRAGFVMSSQASSAGRRRGQGAPEAGRDRRRGRDDRHPLQLLLHPHRALRAVVPQPGQAGGAPRQGADARRPQRLPQGHPQDLRLQPRAAAEPAGHRLALSRRDRAIPGPGVRVPAAACWTKAQACFDVRDEDGETIHPLPDFVDALDALRDALQPFLDTLAEDGRSRRDAERNSTRRGTLFSRDVERSKKPWPSRQTAVGEARQTPTPD